MKKLAKYLYFFSKLTTSFILLFLVLILGYFFYQSYKKQETVYSGKVNNNDVVDQKIDNNSEQIQEISKKINLNNITLSRIENLLKNIPKSNNDDESEELYKMLKILKTEVENIALDFSNLKNKIDQKKPLADSQISKDHITSNKKIDLINIILIKHDNNQNFSDELAVLEDLISTNKKYIFEKLNLLQNKNYKGGLFLNSVFEEESNKFIQEKIKNKSNKFLISAILPYIKIKPSTERVIKDNDLYYLNDIEDLLDNKEYFKSLEKIKLIKDYNVYYSKTIEQLKLVSEFKNLLLEINKFD